jgi:hypothetical protein
MRRAIARWSRGGDGMTTRRRDPPPDAIPPPAAVAAALGRGPVTPGGVRALLRVLRGQPAGYIAATLAAIPDARTRATVAEAVKAAGLFVE